MSRTTLDHEVTGQQRGLDKQPGETAHQLQVPTQSRSLATIVEKKDISPENAKVNQEGEHSLAIATNALNLIPIPFGKSSQMKTVRRTTRYMPLPLQEKLDGPEDLLDPITRKRKKKELLEE